MKLNLTIIFLLILNVSFGQSIPSTKTFYSKTEKGSIGKEEMTFYLSNGYMYKTDNYYGSKTNYGPLYLDETGYSEEGFYFEFFKPDIKNNPLEFSRGKDIIAYKIMYSSKGGNLLIITEAKVVNKQLTYKNFYTNAGYDKVTSETKSSTNNYQLQETSFDVNDVIINSTSLNQIMSKINFSFEQYGEKKISDDGNYVTVRYKNESLINPLITYTRSGQVKQIIIMMPISNMNYIGKELIKRFGTKYVNGEEVIQRGELTYDIRSQDDVGMIVIY